MKDNIISINKFKKDSIFQPIERLKYLDEHEGSSVIEVHKKGNKFDIVGWFGSRNFQTLLNILMSGIDVEKLDLVAELEIDDSMKEDEGDLNDHINHYTIKIVCNDIPVYELLFSQYFYKDGDYDDYIPLNGIRSLEKPEYMRNPFLDVVLKDKEIDYTPMYNHNPALSFFREYEVLGDGGLLLRVLED